MIFQIASIVHGFRATTLPNKPVVEQKQISDRARRSRGSGGGSPREKAAGFGGRHAPQWSHDQTNIQINIVLKQKLIQRQSQKVAEVWGRQPPGKQGGIGGAARHPNV